MVFDLLKKKQPKKSSGSKSPNKTPKNAPSKTKSAPNIHANNAQTPASGSSSNSEQRSNSSSSKRRNKNPLRWWRKKISSVGQPQTPNKKQEAKKIVAPKKSPSVIVDHDRAVPRRARNLNRVKKSGPQFKRPASAPAAPRLSPAQSSMASSDASSAAAGQTNDSGRKRSSAHAAPKLVERSKKTSEKEEKSDPSKNSKSQTSSQQLKPTTETKKQDEPRDEELLWMETLNKEQISRLMLDVTPEMRKLDKVVHDPWADLQTLRDRDKTIYSWQQTRLNTAATYMYFAENELCSVKQEPPSNKKVAITGPINRRTFSVVNLDRQVDDTFDLRDIRMIPTQCLTAETNAPAASSTSKTTESSIALTPKGKK